MPTYELQDKETGMKIRVRGDAQPTEEDMPSLFSAARKDAAAQLSEGTFAKTEDFQRVSKPQQKKRVQQLAAAAMGIGKDDVDVDSGMGLWERTKLDLLPDEPSRMEYLEKKFGSDNVSALNVGGKTKMFYRDPKTKKMTMVDEMGASLADFTADIAGEAITTAGAVGGAVVGTALGPGGTGAGALLGAAGGAALGGFLTGVTQDVAAEVATGQDIELGQKVKQRGIEAAIGVPIDLATAGVGRFFSKRIGQKLTADFSKSLNKADEVITKSEALSGLETGQFGKLPPALRGSQAKSEKASELAQMYPRSRVAKDLENLRNKVSLFQRAVSGEGGTQVTVDSFRRTAQNIAQDYRKVIDEIATIDREAAGVIENSLSRKLQKMAAPKVSTEGVGVQIRNLLAPGVKKIEETNEANWSRLRQLGGETEVPIKSIIRSINEATAQFDRLNLPQAKAIVRDLKKIMKGKEGEPTGIVDFQGNPILGKGVAGKESVSFNEFREIIDQINDAVSRNKEAGFDTRERVATRILENLAGGEAGGLRGSIARQNPQLGQALNETLDYYKNNLLATKRSAVGRTLREQLADPAISDTQVANLAIQDPAYIRQALSIAEQSGGTEAQQLRSQLQDIYLNKIGLLDGVTPSNLTFDDDIVRELFGNRQVRDMENLQKQLVQASKNTNALREGNVTRDEIYELFSAFSGDEKGRILSRIVARNKKEAIARDKANTALIKKLLPKRQNGEFVEPELNGTDLAAFADGFISEKPSKVARAMKAIREQGDSEGEKAFQQEFIAQLFRRYSPGAQMTRVGGVELWNPQRFTQDLKGRYGQNIKANLKEVLGEKQANEILAANDLLREASTFGAREAFGVQPRFSATSGGLQFYIVGDVLRGARNRLLAWAYGSDMLSPMLNFMGAEVAPEVATKNFTKIIVPMLTTEKGLLALARESERDPEFAEAAARLADEIGAQGRD